VAQITRRVRQAGVYFATSDTWERRALFINTSLAEIVVKQIAGCREREFFKLHAFVVMPDHLHVRITPSDETSIERAMQMIKGGSAHQMGIERPQPFPI
jgi:putative transposase